MTDTATHATRALTEESETRGQSIRDHNKYFNRELSWLEFNWRVLHEALDPRAPLLERLKFLGIVSSNLDEFFMKRVGGLKRQAGAGVRQLSIDGRTPQQQLREIRQVVTGMVDAQRRCLIHTVIPQLKRAGLAVLEFEELNDKDRRHVRDYFNRAIFPVLTPLGVDPGHPFPFLSNLSLSLAVRMAGSDNGGRYARVKIPSNLPRWVPLTGERRFCPIEQIIAHHLTALFPGADIQEAQAFRITRNADLERNEEEAEDLLMLIEEELRHRRFAPVVRLEVDRRASPALIDWLQDALDIGADDTYAVPGPLKLADLSDLSGGDGLDAHRWASANSVTHPRLRELEQAETEKDFFQVMREGDFLVHHPYQSFRTSVLKFLDAAADDPRVLAIKQTLYRTAEDSPIIRALTRAAGNGKQVAVLVEIKARFDEANNIEWVKVLENAGVHVTYGLVGLKTHTKTLLVVREDPDGLRSYCHIGTGNYHTGTARLYTDLGLFTTRPTHGEDLVHLFNYLTGHSRYRSWKELLIAPINMRARFLEMIERETRHAKECAAKASSSASSQPRIIAKMNSLEDTEIINALYSASRAGVQIDLIVRGFCCLRPGVPGLSERIRVMSCIGRFLEHSRIFYFHNKGDSEYYIGSADWMHRNLDGRVEAITPVHAEALQASLHHILEAHLRDTRQTWDLQPDGSYMRRRPDSGDPGVQVLLQDPSKGG